MTGRELMNALKALSEEDLDLDVGLGDPSDESMLLRASEVKTMFVGTEGPCANYLYPSAKEYIDDSGGREDMEHMLILI